jgi:hypothetical protein
MKHFLLSAALATGLLSSCSTAYKSAQTPDDLYYSPGRAEITAAKVEKAKVADADVYDEYVSSNDDRYLHMKVANREQWSSIDNYAYWNDSRYDFSSYNYSPMYSSPYGFSYSNFYSNYYSSAYLSMLNPYYMGPGWNMGLGGMGLGCYGMGLGYGGYNTLAWNSPLYTVISYSTPKIPGTTNFSSASNLSAFKNKATSNSNWGYTDTHTGKFVPTSGSQNNYSALSKRVYSNTNNQTSTYDRAARSFTPSTSSAPVSMSSSAGGSSGGFRSTGTTTTTGRGGRN